MCVYYLYTLHGERETVRGPTLVSANIRVRWTPPIVEYWCDQAPQQEDRRRRGREGVEELTTPANCGSPTSPSLAEFWSWKNGDIHRVVRGGALEDNCGLWTSGPTVGLHPCKESVPRSSSLRYTVIRLRDSLANAYRNAYLRCRVCTSSAEESQRGALSLIS